MFKAKLLSAEANFNYVEPGDKLYVTAKWQNVGDDVLSEDAEIAADIVFCGRHRREEDQPTSFRFVWKPFPAMTDWESGAVWSTTGVWKVPEVWGASFRVSLSIILPNGQTLPFLGEHGEETHSQPIAEIDIGWGWGRTRLLEQRRALCAGFNEAEPMSSAAKVPATVTLGDFVLGADYPVITGYRRERWLAFMPCLYERNYQTNITRRYAVTELDSRLIFRDADKMIYALSTGHTYTELVFERISDKLKVCIGEHREDDPYELLHIELPDIAQSDAEDAILTNFFAGGRVIRLRDALPQSYRFVYDTCNMFSVGSSTQMFCVNAADADNVLTQSVTCSGDGQKTAVIGAQLLAHFPAKRAGLRSVPVTPHPVEIYPVEGGDWKTSALLLQRALPEEPRPLYADTLVYKLCCDATGQINESNPVTYCRIYDLKELEQWLLGIAGLTDGVRQVVYIVGWQKGGHDFEYPYPHKSVFNPRLGTAEEFRALEARMREKNIILSFHDNFDDAYFSDNYTLDPDLLAMDEYGQPYKGWLWAGGMSYIMSPSKYVASPALAERIDTTLQEYQIRDTYHLDVLSSENRRYDFTPERPSSAQDNMEAKMQIVDQFNKRGIDVTSETLGFPLLKKIGYAHGTRYVFENDKLFYGERVAPLTTVAMHGAIPYAMGVKTEEDLLRAIACGMTFFTADMDYEHKRFERDYYILVAPMLRLTYRRATDAIRSDGAVQVFYGEDSYTKVCFDTKEYEIVCDGKKIGWNFNTFVPMNGSYYFYSLSGGEFALKLPADWTKIRITALSGDGRGESRILTTENGAFTLNADAMQPYVVEREL